MTLPAWFSPKADKQRQNRRSAAQERQLAADTGGRVQAGSGTSWRARGDVKDDEWLTEAKFTDAGSFSLRVATWLQIERDALNTGREPRMVIEIQGVPLEVRRYSA